MTSRTTLATLGALGAFAAAAPAASAAIEPVGDPTAAGSTRDASISADGRSVAFSSTDTTLVPGDTNGVGDIFVRDARTRGVVRATVGVGGAQANGPSFQPRLSADGRLVAFSSAATNLVAGDTNGQSDLFLRDLVAGATTRVSVGSAGQQATTSSFEPEISADGRFVTFASEAANLVPGDTNGVRDVFVRDRVAGTTERLMAGSAQPNGISTGPMPSADGRFVVFASLASNLVAGDTNGTLDVFVRDRQTGATKRVSVDPSGGQSDTGQASLPSISADGRFVSFSSGATDLVGGDVGTSSDVFVHDRQTGQTTRASSAADGSASNATSAFGRISPDGRLVAFMSNATNLGNGGPGDLMVYDRVADALRIAVPDVVSDDGSEINPSLDASGRLMAFTSERDGVIPGDVDFDFDSFVVQPVRDGLRASAARLEFGAQAATTVGETRAVTLRGPEAVVPARIGSVRLSGAGAEQYLLVRDDCSGRLLGAADTCTVGLRFAPTRSGTAVTASLRIADPAGEGVEVALGGTGDRAPGAGEPGPAGPAGPAGATGPAGPKGEPGRIICRRGALRTCELLFPAGSFEPEVTAVVMQLTRGTRMLASARRTVRAGASTKLVLQRPRGLKPGRYRLRVRTIAAGERRTIARRTLRLGAR